MLFPPHFTDLMVDTVNEEIKSASSETLQEFYFKCFAMAETEGIEKSQISKVIYKKLNKIKEGIVRKENPDALPEDCMIGKPWYMKCARKAGVTDLKYSNKEEDNGILRYPQDTSYIPEQKPINTVPIAAVQYIRSICNVLEDEFRTFTDNEGNPLDLSEIIDQKHIDAFSQDIVALGKMASDVADHKTVVPVRAHSIFKTAMHVETSILNAGRALLLARLKIMESVGKFLTHKQSSKFLRGREKPQLPIYKPKSRDESIYMGWYGTSCRECKSWRTQKSDSESDLLICYDCGAGTPPETILGCVGAGSCGYLFYDDDLRKVRESGVCPSCRREIRLPAAMA